MADTPYFMTGALGCIGAWVVKALVDRGDVPVVFDKSDDARRLKLLLDDRALGRVRFMRGDVTDAPTLRAALEQSGARRVIHLAGRRARQRRRHDQHLRGRPRARPEPGRLRQLGGRLRTCR